MKELTFGEELEGRVDAVEKDEAISLELAMAKGKNTLSNPLNARLVLGNFLVCLTNGRFDEWLSWPFLDRPTLDVTKCKPDVRWWCAAFGTRSHP